MAAKHHQEPTDVVFPGDCRGATGDALVREFAEMEAKFHLLLRPVATCRCTTAEC